MPKLVPPPSFNPNPASAAVARFWAAPPESLVSFETARRVLVLSDRALRALVHNGTLPRVDPEGTVWASRFRKVDVVRVFDSRERMRDPWNRYPTEIGEAA